MFQMSYNLQACEKSNIIFASKIMNWEETTWDEIKHGDSY